MYTNFDIERVISPLENERFTFYVDDKSKITLEGYYLFTKESIKKRKYTAKYHYRRISGRDNNINYEEIPLTKEIKEQALEKARAMITFE